MCAGSGARPPAACWPAARTASTLPMVPAAEGSGQQLGALLALNVGRRLVLHGWATGDAGEGGATPTSICSPPHPALPL